MLSWCGAQELNKMVLVMVHLGAQLYRLDPECGKEACGCFGRVIVQRCGTMGTVHVICFRSTHCLDYQNRSYAANCPFPLAAKVAQLAEALLFYIPSHL